MWLFVGAILFGTFLVVLYLLSPLITPKPLKLLNAHVLITGGSSGIGKAVAIEVAKQGANVTVLARNLQKLSNAKQEIESYMKDKENQRIVCISVDLSKDYSAVEKAVKQAEELLGPVHLLVNSAGTSVSGRFEDIPVEQFKSMMDVNYLGSVYATRAVIGAMKQQEFGRIVFVSSQAGQTGLHGYTCYSATKFALRGLAECLQMELKPYNIYVTVSHPPDTDTPGFALEQLTKTKETRLLSETGGLFESKYVAQCIVQDAMKGNFLSYVGLDGYMLAALTCGMSPVISITEATQQVVTMGIFRIISLFYLDSFDRTIKKCKQEDEQREKMK